MSVLPGQAWAVGDELTFEVPASAMGPRAISVERSMTVIRINRKVLRIAAPS
ncbi:hypothetical protein [Mycolicibacterium vanbaalenii]|uniref:hypothetical protein n=1 Tax=Mycolicibacterium vanbaalenii TaxID=110539 RepID=UPI0002F870BD|nr:hypothetical protein [Mycolicibacterium vanbaalenii]MCV7127747.1 hypothetical protein [Mycolicibacterium vanbaalenii PYR-1]